MDTIEAIMTRRSIRKYQTTTVSDEDMKTVLEAARWAPSWANTQCVRFIVVRNKETQAKLSALLRGRGVEAIRDAPLVIVACAELERSGFYHGEAVTNKGDWFMFDVALAMQNLVLAAHALGLGTVHVGWFDDKQAAEILGVPTGFRVVEMTPLGYPDQNPPPPPRKELSEIVFYEKWPTGELS